MLQPLNVLWETLEAGRRELIKEIESLHTVMFSHPAAGPMTAAQAMDLTLVHLDHHRRQIDRIRDALDAA